MNRPIIVHSEESNSLGLAGFVIALVGFMTCGLISPIGLIFSLCGLAGRPRGLAIAGTVFGLLGSLWLFFFGFAMVMAMLGIRATATAAAKAMDKISQKVEQDAKQARDEIAKIEKAKATSAQSLTAPENRLPRLIKPPVVVEKTPAKEIEPPAKPNPEIVPESPRVIPEPSIPKRPSRIWTSTSGFKVDAELLQFSGEKVLLKRLDNGKEIELPENKLSIEDRNWLRKMRARGSLDADGRPFPLGTFN